MTRVVLYCAWIWSLFANVVVAPKHRGPVCLSQEEQTIRQYTCTQVKCKRRHVIAGFDPVSGLKNDNPHPPQYPLCMGETAAFIDESLNCFWKPSCTVKFPTGRMVTSKGGELETFTRGQRPANYKCYHQYPDFTCIINAKCVKKSEIFDIASLCHKKTGKIKKKKGIIRSHDHYPWHFSPTASTNIRDFELTKRIGQSKSIQVGVYDLDIHDDDDITMTTAIRTVVLNSSCITMNGERFGDLTAVLRFNHTDQYMKFTFHLTVESMRHFRGFVICFKESKKGGGNHPCKRIFKNADVISIDPYSHTCIDSLNGTKAKKNCCCDIKDEESCNNAIQEAQFKREHMYR